MKLHRQVWKLGGILKSECFPDSLFIRREWSSFKLIPKAADFVLTWSPGMLSQDRLPNSRADKSDITKDRRPS